MSQFELGKLRRSAYEQAQHLMRRLRNKAAIITGGAHGLGRIISQVFAEEGAAVCILDTDEAAGAQMVFAIRRREGEASFIRTNGSSEEEANRAVQLAAEQGRRVDVLCNAAVHTEHWHSAIETSPSEWARSIEVTLMGAQHMTRAVLPFMIRQKSGSIINLASVRGLAGGRNAVTEGTIQAALLGFTRSVAADYGAFNIRANAICAGAIQTEDGTAPNGELTPADGHIFLGRAGQPHEVAYAALFLASDEASYITGAVLPVDGGWKAS